MATTNRKAVDVRFKHPFTATIASCTKSGKTVLCKKIIQHIKYLMDIVPKEIWWCYSVYKPDDLGSNVQFIEGLPDVEKIKKSKKIPKLLVLDDLQDALSTSTDLKELFSKFSHHFNISVINIVQNLFYKNLRDSRINSHYLFLLKNPADRLQAHNLARQIYPGQVKEFMKVFKEVTEAPYSYLLVDCSPEADDLVRLRSNIFPGEQTVVYILE